MIDDPEHDHTGVPATRDRPHIFGATCFGIRMGVKSGILILLTSVTEKRVNVYSISISISLFFARPQIGTS